MKVIRKRTIKTVKVDDYRLAVNPCSKDDMPDLEECYDYSDYEYFYEVRNWDIHGVVFFYIAKYKGKKEYHVHYGNGLAWSSFGETIEKAVEGGKRNGFLYTR